MNAKSPYIGEVANNGDVWRTMEVCVPLAAGSASIVRRCSPYIATSPERGENTGTVDTAALRQSVDLLELVGSDSTLRKVASTRGGEYAGPCPWCGGEDRFRVQPAQGLWFCRQCSEDGRWSDAIGYVMRRDGVAFREACVRLEGGTFQAARPMAPRAQTVAHAAEAAEPSAEWRAKAEAFVTRCEEALWSPVGEWARHYLRGHRGLAPATIRAWRLGWRLDPSGYTTGITIPWYLDGEVWHVKTRRLNPTAETWAQAEDVGTPKYRSVKGGHPVLFGAHTLQGHRIAVATEGEFDCLLAWQEVGALMGAVTMGSCSKGVDARALPHLLGLTRVLVAYDNDEEGRKGAAKLAASSGRMRVVQVPEGKDISEFYDRGGDVVSWLTNEAGTHWPEPFVPARTEGAA